MQCIPLGRITVSAAGTPVPITPSLLSSAQLNMLPPSGQVGKVEVWPDPAAAGKVFVKNGAGTILATLPVAASGAVFPWSTPDCEFNQIAAFASGTGTIGGSLVSFNGTSGGFALDAATSGDGAFVTLWIE